MKPNFPSKCGQSISQMCGAGILKIFNLCFTKSKYLRSPFGAINELKYSTNKIYYKFFFQNINMAYELFDDLYSGQHQYSIDNFHLKVSFLPAHINFNCSALTQKFISKLMAYAIRCLILSAVNFPLKCKLVQFITSKALYIVCVLFFRIQLRVTHQKFSSQPVMCYKAKTHQTWLCRRQPTKKKFLLVFWVIIFKSLLFSLC